MFQTNLDSPNRDFLMSLLTFKKNIPDTISNCNESNLPYSNKHFILFKLFSCHSAITLTRTILSTKTDSVGVEAGPVVLKYSVLSSVWTGGVLCSSVSGGLATWGVGERWGRETNLSWNLENKIHLNLHWVFFRTHVQESRGQLSLGPYQGYCPQKWWFPIKYYSWVTEELDLHGLCYRHTVT